MEKRTCLRTSHRVAFEAYFRGRGVHEKFDEKKGQKGIPTVVIETAGGVHWLCFFLLCAAT